MYICPPALFKSLFHICSSVSAETEQRGVRHVTIDRRRKRQFMTEERPPTPLNGFFIIYHLIHAVLTPDLSLFVCMNEAEMILCSNRLGSSAIQANKMHNKLQSVKKKVVERPQHLKFPSGIQQFDQLPTDFLFLSLPCACFTFYMLFLISVLLLLSALCRWGRSHGTSAS